MMNRMVMVMVVGIVFALPLFGGVEGSWSGTLDAMGQKLQLVFHIKENKCTLDSPDQGTFGIVGIIMSIKEMDMELLFKSIGGRYSGKIEEGRLCGTWKQSVASTSFQYQCDSAAVVTENGTSGK